MARVDQLTQDLLAQNLLATGGFAERHIGTDSEAQATMLDALGQHSHKYATVDAHISRTDDAWGLPNPASATRPNESAKITFLQSPMASRVRAVAEKSAIRR